MGEADYGDATDFESVDEVSADEAPLLGTAAGKDGADRLCNVVLRSVTRATAATGPQSSCVNGTCWFVWNGTFDASKEAVATGGLRGYVLFESTTEPGHWYKATAAKTTGAPAGFQRYKFKLSTHTVESGVSATALQRSVISSSPTSSPPTARATSITTASSPTPRATSWTSTRIGPSVRPRRVRPRVHPRHGLLPEER